MLFPPTLPASVARVCKSLRHFVGLFWSDQDFPIPPVGLWKETKGARHASKPHPSKAPKPPRMPRKGAGLYDRAVGFTVVLVQPPPSPDPGTDNADSASQRPCVALGRPKCEIKLPTPILFAYARVRFMRYFFATARFCCGAEFLTTPGHPSG